MTTPRGTSNSNVRGNTAARAARRAWLMKTYESNVPELVRCYRCCIFLYNPDGVNISSSASPNDKKLALFEVPAEGLTGGHRMILASPLTIDRIIPGALGGTYAKTNIRPSCQECATITGNALKAAMKAKTGWKRCSGSGKHVHLTWPRDAAEGYPGAVVCNCTFGVLVRKRGGTEWTGIVRSHDVLWEADQYRCGPEPVRFRYTTPIKEATK